MAATMHAYGVRFAFGIPGNDVLELFRACDTAGIRTIVPKSEPSAAFMADAVAHVTGNPAACIFALGPGIANAASGIAGAMMERAPLVVLGGEMGANNRSIYNHQVFDHVAGMTPVTKFAAELNAGRAGQQMARALDIALDHPRGPVFLNCPADATRAVSTEAKRSIPEPRRHGALTAVGIEAATKQLAAAVRPVALIGSGALRGQTPERMAAFIDAWRMPFFQTYKAKGLVPETHALCLGAVALSPVVDDISLKLIREADLIVLIGFDPIELRDAWLDAWAPQQRIMSIEWAAQSHRIFPTGEQLIGDVAAIVEQLTPAHAKPLGWLTSRLSAHKQAVAEVVRPREPDGRISPAGLFAAVSRRVTTNTIMSVDVGAHRILANHVINCVTPGQLLQSNGFGCMGYAIPAAIGAALAAPEKRIIAMLGDGCALMSLGELAVVAEQKLAVVTIILNDASLALIELKQSKMGMDPLATTFKSPNFADIAKGFGIASERVTSLAAFDAALEKATVAGTAHVIEAMVDPAEYWEQM